MVTVTLLLLALMASASLRLFITVTTYDLAEEHFWVDEPMDMTAGDQAVVEIALCLCDLEQEVAQELDENKRQQLSQQMKKESAHLVRTIMSINHLGTNEIP